MLGIEKYKPQFYQDSESFIERHQNTLCSLIDKTITETWLMWSIESDEWWEDGPVILKIGENNFEFTAFQLDDFSLTINEIDLDKPLDWYGAGDEIPLTWKQNCHEALNSILNLPIKTIDILNFNMSTTIIESKRSPEKIGETSESGFMLHGIQFGFEKNGKTVWLVVYNGLDMTNVTSKRYKENAQHEVIKICR